jgi:hypothetical protein
MSKNAFEVFIVGHRDVISKWPQKANAAGVLIDVGRAPSENSVADCCHASRRFFVGRDGLALLAFVTEGGEASLWQPRDSDEWALCVAAKSDLTDDQTIEAHRTVFDLIRAFDKDPVTLLVLVEGNGGSVSLREIPVHDSDGGL